jgi:membrane-anchored protein YejM (alkaline phosphatase superfamily)
MEGIGLPSSILWHVLLLVGGAIGVAVGVSVAASIAAQRLIRAKRWITYLGWVALVLFVAERLAYSVLSPGMMSDRDDPSEVLPLNALFSFRLPEETVFIVFGLKDPYRRQIEARAGSAPKLSDVQYPSSEARNFAPGPKQRPNIILLGIESLRADAVDPKFTPNLFALAEAHIWARAHFSGSNSTHLGLFTLLYGLSPRTWGPMIDLSQPPYLYQLLRRAGYDISATSSANPHWFGIDRQALPPQLALGRYQRAADPDGEAVADLIRYIRTPRASPFFSFLFLNGTHYPYYVPPQGDIFRPQVDQIDISDPQLFRHRQEIINRYRNSLHRIDQLVGKILEALRDGHLEDETILAVTGDHGESFWDDGRIFHTSLLSVAQLHVPLVLSIPGRPPHRIETISSHVDVVPTLLEAAGIELDPSTYSDGHSLLSQDTKEAFAAQHSMGYPRDFALVRTQSLVRFRLENGRLRFLGGEGIQGGALDGEEREKLEADALPAILKSFRYTSRWWPAPHPSP